MIPFRNAGVVVVDNPWFEGAEGAEWRCGNGLMPRDGAGRVLASEAETCRSSSEEAEGFRDKHCSPMIKACRLCKAFASPSVNRLHTLELVQISVVHWRPSETCSSSNADLSSCDHAPYAIGSRRILSRHPGYQCKERYEM